MKNTLACFSALFVTGVCVAAAHDGAVSDDDALSQARAALAKLSLEEKVSLCAGNGTFTLNAIPHAGIKEEWYFSDNSSTVNAEMNRWTWGASGAKGDESTMLPSMSALASTWNVELARAHGDVLGSEAAHRGKDQMLGPGVNLMRTPLCGRNWEYLSEDPCLAGDLAAAMIRGVQSHDVAACVKHFCLNNQENDRFRVDVTVDDRTLNELYLEPFRRAIVRGGAWTVMSAYNKYNGDFISENPFLQRCVLRERWGFKGQIVTDWGGQRSCAKAAKAGCGVEMDMGGNIHHLFNPKEKKYPLADAVRRGEVCEATVDDMALRVLWVMAKAKFLGGRHRAPGERNTPRHQEVARTIGEESIALLKNDLATLPLDPAKVKRILVAGTLGDVEHCGLGWSASGKPPYEITPLKGLEEYFAKRGVAIEFDRVPLATGDAAASAVDIDVRHLDTFAGDAAGYQQRSWKAEYFRGKDPVGKPVCVDWPRKLDFTTGIGAPHQEELFKAGGDDRAFAIRYTAKLVAPESGRFYFSAATSASWPIEASFTLDGKDVLPRKPKGVVVREQVFAYAELEKGRAYDAEVIYRGVAKQGEVNRLKFVWLPPSNAGDPAKMRAMAEAADAVLVLTGTTLGHGRAKECEGGDRPDLKLPDGMDETVATILSWKLPKTVVVNHSGAPVEMPWVGQCPTLLQMSYLGQESGRALARVLFGDVNPSGHLPCSWPKRLEDTAVAQMGTLTPTNSIYNERFYIGYRWHDRKGIEPMFPFGYGLSYTTFKVGGCEVSAKGARGESEWTVSAEVANAGRVAGKEVVQFYVACPGAKVERCVKDLRGFAKTRLLKPGEKERLACTLTPRDLAYWDTFANRFRADAGEYEVLVGTSAKEIVGKVRLSLAEPVEFAH